MELHSGETGLYPNMGIGGKGVVCERCGGAVEDIRTETI